jgi:hypothetical protein
MSESLDDVEVLVEVDDSQAADKTEQKKNERVWKLYILLKIIITAMQIVSQCPVKLNLPLLPLFTYLWLIFDKFNFDFINLIPISCYTSYGYLDSMFYLSFMPICISLFLVTTYHVQIYLYRWQHLNELKEDRSKREGIYRQYYTHDNILDHDVLYIANRSSQGDVNVPMHRRGLEE